MDAMLSTSEVAELTGISLRHVKRLAASNKLPCEKTVNSNGVNLAAVAGNGRRVVTNLLDALTPIIREGAERSMEEKADKAVQTAKANRAARRAAAKK